MPRVVLSSREAPLSLALGGTEVVFKGPADGAEGECPARSVCPLCLSFLKLVREAVAGAWLCEGLRGSFPDGGPCVARSPLRREEARDSRLFTCILLVGWTLSPMSTHCFWNETQPLNHIKRRRICETGLGTTVHVPNLAHGQFLSIRLDGNTAHPLTYSLRCFQGNRAAGETEYGTTWPTELKIFPI